MKREGYSLKYYLKKDKEGNRGDIVKWYNAYSGRLLQGSSSCRLPGVTARWLIRVKECGYR